MNEGTILSFPPNLGILEEQRRYESFSGAGLTASQDKQQAGTRMLCLMTAHSLFSFSLKETHQTLHTWSLSLLIAFLVLHVHKNNFCLGFFFFFFKCRNFKKRLGLFYSPGWEGVSLHIHGYRHTHTGQSLPLPFWAALLDLGEQQQQKTRLNAPGHFVGQTEHCLWSQLL